MAESGIVEMTVAVRAAEYVALDPVLVEEVGRRVAAAIHERVERELLAATVARPVAWPWGVSPLEVMRRAVWVAEEPAPVNAALWAIWGEVPTRR